MTHSDENPVGGNIWQHLLEMAVSSAAPQLSARALDDRFGRRSSWIPTTGQLWRAAYADVTALVIVLDVFPESVLVAPLTTESIPDVPEVVVLDSESTVLGVQVSVWPLLVRTLPIHVLDRPVDDLHSALADRLIEWRDSVRSATKTNFSLAVDPVVSAVESGLEDDLDELAETSVLGSVDQPSTPLPNGPAQGIDFESATTEDINTLVLRLGVTMQIVFDLLDGKRQPTPPQAQTISEVLGAVPVAEPLPPGLIVEMCQPRWRGLVRDRARRHRLQENAARAELTQEVFAVAARQTGEQDPYWPYRVQRWAEGHALDPDSDA